MLSTRVIVARQYRIRCPDRLHLVQNGFPLEFRTVFSFREVGRVRYGEDYCAAAEILYTIPIIMAFCDLTALEKILVAIAFGLDTDNRGLLLIFGNNPTAVGIDWSYDDNLLAVVGF